MVGSVPPVLVLPGPDNGNATLLLSDTPLLPAFACISDALSYEKVGGSFQPGSGAGKPGKRFLFQETDHIIRLNTFSLR